MPNYYNFPLLKTGLRKDASGQATNITLDVLEDLKASYDPEGKYEAQVVIGHEEDLAAIPRNDRAPSYGQIKRLRIVPEGEEYKLEGIVDVIDEADSWIKRKLYNHRSLAYYEPGNEYSPDPESYYIRHVALLGAQPPAIKDLGKVVKYSEGLKNMVVAFQEGEEITQEIQAPGPNASPDEIKSFLDTNAVAFFTEVLTSGDRGYTGEIISFDPMPTAENNYLYDAETGRYKGKFIDEDEEVFLFEFDSNSKSFIPEIQTEEGEEEMTEMGEGSAAGQAMEQEDFLASFGEGCYKCKKGDYVYVLKKMPMGDMYGDMEDGMMYQMEDDDVSAFMGKKRQYQEDDMEGEEEMVQDPMMEEVVAQSVEDDEEVVALREKIKLQGEELVRLREEKKAKRREELRGFATKVYSEGKILKTEIPEKDLVTLLTALDESKEMKAFAEGGDVPFDILTKILENAAPKLPMEGMTSLAEGGEEVTTDLEIPAGMEMDSDQALLHSKAKKVAKEKNITFMKALSEVLATA